jgi:hypothetical protein
MMHALRNFVIVKVVRRVGDSRLTKSKLQTVVEPSLAGEEVGTLCIRRTVYRVTYALMAQFPYAVICLCL